jgi:hypothetical protein
MVGLPLGSKSRASALHGRRSMAGEVGSGGGEADPAGEAGGALPLVSNGGDALWMGSAGPWMGLLVLSTGFLFYLINRGGRPTASVKDFCPPRLRLL